MYRHVLKESLDIVVYVRLEVSVRAETLPSAYIFCCYCLGVNYQAVVVLP